MPRDQRIAAIAARQDSLIMAALSCGDGAIATHQAALARREVRPMSPGPVDITLVVLRTTWRELTRESHALVARTAEALALNRGDARRAP